MSSLASAVAGGDGLRVARREARSGRPAQADFPKLWLSAGKGVDRTGQANPAGLGEVRSRRPLELVLLVSPRLGRKEDSGPLGEKLPSSRLWIESVESGMVVWGDWTRPRIPRDPITVVLDSRSDLLGLMNLVVQCAGARREGDPHIACRVAGG